MANSDSEDEDKALFQAFTRDVKPLAPDPSGRLSRLAQKPAPEPRLRRDKKPVYTSKPEYFVSDFIVDEVQSETTLSYRTASVSNQRFKALYQGQIPWKSRLDLHGCFADQARDRLLEFVDIQHREGHQCALIIHGKGGQLGQAPVIKNLVNRWLRQLPQVLAFHSATPKHGGCGALYVLLAGRRTVDQE